MNDNNEEGNKHQLINNNNIFFASDNHNNNSSADTRTMLIINFISASTLMDNETMLLRANGILLFIMLALPLQQSLITMRQMFLGAP